MCRSSPGFVGSCVAVVGPVGSSASPMAPSSEPEPSSEPVESSKPVDTRTQPGERRRRKLLSVVLVAALLAVTAVSLLGITITAPDYNDAQRASNVQTFQRIVSPRAVEDFRLAAYFDLVFALGYGLLALVALTWFVKRSGRWSRVGQVVFIGAFVAALFDEAENLTLLRNLSNRNSVSESAIDAMTRIGLAKWICVIPALLVVLASPVLVPAWCWRERARRSG